MSFDENHSKPGRAWLWLIGIASVVTVVLVFTLPRPTFGLKSSGAGKGPTSSDSTVRGITYSRTAALPHPAPSAEERSASEMVADKLGHFARNRRDITYAMAAKYNVQVPASVREFFDAMERGDWNQTQSMFQSLSNLIRSADAPEGLHEKIWAPIVEAYGVAETAHKWPAQQLLDYGQAVLGSLKPGMVYVGGTDAGRFIPTLLSETSGGERPIVLTQNALADGTYLKYVSFLYGDRLISPGEEDSSRVFSEYIADAQKRFIHDQQFPDEPKQIRPGEDIKMVDGRTTIAGQVAVMAINERLLQNILDKNPGVSFALEESFPLKSTYSAAVPLGPIMELRGSDAQAAYNTDTAAQAVDYWRATADQLALDSAAGEDSPARREYSKMALAQANLLVDHNYPSAAEQAMRIASEICPTNPEVVFSYVNLLLRQNRLQEAFGVAQAGFTAAPDNQQFKALVDSLRTKMSK